LLCGRSRGELKSHVEEGRDFPAAAKAAMNYSPAQGGASRQHLSREIGERESNPKMLPEASARGNKVGGSAS